MKKGVIILLTVFLLGCNKNSDVTDQYNLSANPIITLKYKECIDISDFGFKICLDSILNDSRCPSGVDCVWEGDAQVRFSIKKADEIKLFRLHTQRNFQRDTTINGLKISLVSLTPYPGDGSAIDQKDYSAGIKVIDE